MTKNKLSVKILNNNKNKTDDAKIKPYVHLQRVGVDESPIERSMASGSQRVR